MSQREGDREAREKRQEEEEEADTQNEQEQCGRLREGESNEDRPLVERERHHNDPLT